MVKQNDCGGLDDVESMYRGLCLPWVRFSSREGRSEGGGGGGSYLERCPVMLVETSSCWF